MKFPYSKFSLPNKTSFFGKHLLKPIIPIGVFYKNKKIRYSALIDSGADFCIFDAEVGEYLGIDVKSGEKITFKGIEGANTVEAFLHEIILDIGGWDYKTTVGFSYHISRSGFGVLGQKGFFDIFIVKFDLLKEEIELKERKKI